MVLKITNNTYSFQLWLPLSLLKFILKHVNKHTKDINIYYDVMPLFYKSLKKYIKKNGHFVFLEINSADGNNILIKV